MNISFLLLHLNENSTTVRYNFEIELKQGLMLEHARTNTLHLNRQRILQFGINIWLGMESDC